MNKQKIILHGHFYQPPRENPWTGTIEHQESAAPYSDWNSRITAESYGACAYSRVVDGDGAIESIVNNYRYLSFNFGPTLLSWLETESPNVYRRIIEADEESRHRLGFGNAVAQSYNHTILPLDREEDARTQIRWGLIDFQHRFGRRADGMWLPECGVNETVLDLLIDEGLSYVVLSPWQAESVENDKGVMMDLAGRPAPSDRAFRIQGPGGSIAAFFYDPDLASAISFGHLLRSREGLEIALRNALKGSESLMVNVATDGEIYGHHEPFGDMCLSSLVDHWRDNPNIGFTNYASYLHEQPAKRSATLRKGDDGMGTSWSCSHGLGRWMRDCGCQTGGDDGWNQKWRGPLRDSFNALRDRAEPIWSSRVEEITGRPHREVLDAYGLLIADSDSRDDFLRKYMPKDAPKERRQDLLLMLEGVKYLQFMYTSCGWFFSDISGIEPLQNMRYAYRAAELIDPTDDIGLARLLSERLKDARSNIQSFGKGSDLLRTMVIPAKPADIRVPALFFWRHLHNLPGKDRSTWGAWAGEGVTRRIAEAEEGRLLLTGKISYSEPSTLRCFEVGYKAFVDGGLFCPSIEIEKGGNRTLIEIREMPMALRLEIRDALKYRSDRKLMEFMGRQFEDRIRDHQVVEALNLSFGVSGWQSLELSLHHGPLLLLDQLERTPLDEWPPLVGVLDRMLTKRMQMEMDVDDGGLLKRAGDLINRIAEDLQVCHEAPEIVPVYSLLEVVRRYGLRPLRPQIQNAVFALLEEEKNLPAHLPDLARLLNINPDRYI